jgi:hypothetical protein
VENFQAEVFNMTERSFRIILGIALLLMLSLNFDMGIYVFIGVLAFEGITNLRIPLLASRFRYGTAFSSNEALSPGCSRIPFDAERALRLLVAALLVATFILYREQTWFFPWFIGSMLLLAGITNICPMVMALRWAGFK